MAAGVPPNDVAHASWFETHNICVTFRSADHVRFAFARQLPENRSSQAFRVLHNPLEQTCNAGVLDRLRTDKRAVLQMLTATPQYQ